MVEIGKFIQESYPGQNGQILLLSYKGQVLVKMVEFWSKWQNLYSRVVLFKYWSNMLNYGQNGESFAEMLKFIVNSFTGQNGQIYTVELCQSTTSQNGQILVKMVKIILQRCTSHVMVKNVEIWSKQSNLYWLSS